VIDRRRFIGTVAGGLVIAWSVARAQPAATMRRVGGLSLGSKAGTADVYAAFKQGMEDLGWLEGKNLEYRIAYADLVVDRLDALAGELIGWNAEVIIVGNATTTRAARRATKTIPIVMANVANPVGNGFVASLGKPEGNITGVATQQDEVLGKLIGILHEIAPGAQRVAILLNESSPNHSAYWTAAQRACSALGLVALRIAASTPADLGTAVGEIVRQRSQAVVVPTDPMYLYERVRLQALLQTTRLPVAYGWREHVVAGGLLSYASDIAVTYRHAAKYVDKILKGAKPAALPVEQPTKFELVINLKTAKALSITIPKDLLLRADEVIK
jgi:putative ABC transport system substrate-binding protein